MTINKFAVFAKTLFLSALLVAIVAMAGIRVAFAADGDLDQAFAVTGKTLTDFQYGGSIGSSVVVQPDGKAVVSGLVYNENYESIWGIARYNVDGTLDQTFGTGGKATVDFKAYYTWKIDMKLQSDGKILLASFQGDQTDVYGRGTTILTRFNPDGVPDDTFAPVTFDGEIYQMALQPDSRLLLAGSFNEVNGVKRAGLARLNMHPPLEFGSPTLSRSGTLQISLTAEPAMTYIIEASADLRNWAPLSTNTASAFRIDVPDSNISNSAKRFYRALLKPEIAF